MRRYVGARLHRRLFLFMGLAILVTFALAGATVHWLGNHEDYDNRRTKIEAFAARRFAEVWTDSERRNRLAYEVTDSFGIHLLLRDAQGRELFRSGSGCEKGWSTLTIPALPAGKTSGGTVSLCDGPFSSGPGSRFLWALLVFAVVLWLTSGAIARRLGRPLGKLVQVTTQIGEGELSARVRLGRHRGDEVGLLSESINRMAERIEKQMLDQRQLLAGVSHEIRTPLSRLRIIVELLRQKWGEGRLLDDAEREIDEVNDLTGQLLASSRLEFVALDQRTLDAVELGREALRRVGADERLLVVEAADPVFQGDPTLIARAITNLLGNATDHGKGIDALVVSDEPRKLRFCVLDQGPGFSEEDGHRVFDPFVQGAQKESSVPSTTLGLGLTLVKRIAEAHHGGVLLENRSGGGASVGFWVPRGDQSV